MGGAVRLPRISSLLPRSNKYIHVAVSLTACVPGPHRIDRDLCLKLMMTRDRMPANVKR